MSHHYSGGRIYTRSDDKNDKAPLSRLFVTNVKGLNETDIKDYFQPFGSIAYVHIVTDRSTQESKGIAYIKYNKTSDAARALEQMNGKSLGNMTKSIKVFVASDKTEGSQRIRDNFVRLFVVISKTTTEQELTQEFEKHGELDTVSIIRDKVTRESKGFAFISYFKFSDAATAFENCNSKYKVMFADPRPTNSDNESYARDDRRRGNSSGIPTSLTPSRRQFFSRKRSSADSEKVQLTVICSSLLNQDQLWKLFDIVPGFNYCQFNGEDMKYLNAIAIFNDIESAMYAIQKLHGFEYPPGHRLIVKLYDEDTASGSMISSSSSSYRNNDSRNRQIDDSTVDCEVTEMITNVSLPKPEPLVDPNTACVMRCFVICTPRVLAQDILIDIFSRFGNLIDVYMLHNKKCGYAKYASEGSALNAIEVLNDTEICGVTLKVMEAEELRVSNKRTKTYN